MNNSLDTGIIFFYSILFLIVLIILLYLIRLFIGFYRTSKNLKQKDASQVGFVVDTFHELVSQLKEKEKELEILGKKAEDRAIAIEGYNENILQSVPSGVISFDQEMRITKVNLAAEKILEVRRENIISEYHTDVLNKPIIDFLNDRKVIERGEIAYTTPSGKRIWLGLTLSPLKNMDGNTLLSIFYGHLIILQEAK